MTTYSLLHTAAEAGFPLVLLGDCFPARLVGPEAVLLLELVATIGCHTGAEACVTEICRWKLHAPLQRHGAAASQSAHP